MWFFGFYRSLIRFFDSMDAILTALIGSLIFGFGWTLIYLSQLNFSDSNIIFIAFLQGIILSFLFYALINIIRIIARILIYPNSNEENAIPVVIYGAGAAGKELMEAVQIDKSKNLINDKKIGKICIREQVLKDLPPKELRAIIDQGKKEIKSGIVIAVSIFDNKLISKMDGLF